MGKTNPGFRTGVSAVDALIFISLMIREVEPIEIIGTSNLKLLDASLLPIGDLSWKR